jgi:hypothetical protein
MMTLQPFDTNAHLFACPASTCFSDPTYLSISTPHRTDTLSEARVRTTLDTQSLQNSNQSQGSCRGLVAALVVACSGTDKQADEKCGNGLVIYIIYACLSPFVVQDACLT